MSCSKISAERLNPDVQITDGVYRGQTVLVVKCHVQQSCAAEMLEHCPEGFRVLPAPDKDSPLPIWQYRIVFDCNACIP